MQGNNLKEQWWLAYQPTGYEIDSQYGTKDDLVSLIVKAKQHNLKIIADIVFNHTAAPDGVEKNEWLQALENAHAGYPNQYNMYMTQLQKVHSSFNLPEHFNPFKMNRSPYYHWNTDEQKIKIIKAYDEPRIWMAGALPSLNLDHDAVWSAQSKYLEDLIEIGIKGFRFDLLAFFDPERHWQKYHNFLKEKKAFAYGELITEKNNYPPFIQYGRTTDHEFAKALESAFSHPDDDMRKLRMPTTNGDPGSITYTNTHDMETYRVGNKIKDPVNRKLATLFLIARRDGIPLILDHDHDDETNTQEFEEAIQFRKIMIEKYDNPEELIIDTENCSDIASADQDTSSRTIMILTRQDKGFMILNMRGEPLEAIFKFPGTNINGFYRRIGDLSKALVNISEDGCMLSVPARSAVFFVQAHHQESALNFELH